MLNNIFVAMCSIIFFKTRFNNKAYQVSIAFIIGAIATFRSTFGQGGGPLTLDYIYCTGTEARLSDCRSGTVNQFYCNRFKEAGVKCFLRTSKCIV